MEHDKAALRQRLNDIKRSFDDLATRDFGRVFGRWRKLSKAGKLDEKALVSLEKLVADSRMHKQQRQMAKPTLEMDADLPISQHANAIIKAIKDHQVVVIAGATGSGKTTQLPKLCLAAGCGEAGLVGCTQPRRLAARSVARRVADEMHTQVGGKVGFKVRFSEQASAQTLVKFMTDGILLQEAQRDKWLSEYDTLIIDEAHERSLNIDFLLGFIKKLIRKRRNLKVIITSATIDTARFAEHFDSAPVIEVQGRTYPVEVRYRPVEDVRIEQAGAEHIALAVDELTKDKVRGDILVFLPGEREIRDAHKALERRQYRHTEVLALYARLSAREQDRIFHPGPMRRIVLATNVAETSLTVPRIHAVVDSGNARVLRYSRRSQIDRLHVEAVSQASANQRKGRCGRIAPGICIRLYSEDDFNARDEFTDPELLRSSLTNVILRMLALRLGRVEDFPFLDKPPEQAIKDGYRHLLELFAIDARYDLTAIGKELAHMPIDAQLARMLLEARRLQVLDEVLPMVAFLSVQDPRERPADKRGDADAAHRQFADPKSDFVGMLNLWQAWRDARDELGSSQLSKWCKKHFLGYMRMREWAQVNRQLKQLIQQDKVSDSDIKRPQKQGKKAQKQAFRDIHMSLMAGFPVQVGHKDEHGVFRGTRERKFDLFPGSALAKKPPRWLFAGQIMDVSGKVWAMHGAEVEPQWIETQARHLIRKKAFEPYWSRQRGAVMAYEQTTLFGLILVPRRAVVFRDQDPALAHQVFLCEALARAELDAKAGFVAANRRVLLEAEDMEAKQRQQGLIRAEDELADFFKGKLPDYITDVRALDAWYRRASKPEQQALYWTLDDVLQNDDTLGANEFPSALEVDGRAYRLTYRFVPGDIADGVSLHVPLAHLNRLSYPACEWLVPGLLQEKVTELIRSLPKNKRRNFVPAPDFARAFIETEPDHKHGLSETLRKFLTRTTGIVLDDDVFAPENLPEHLHMRFLLEDDKGKKLDAGRDLERLKSQWQGQAREAFVSHTDVDIEQHQVMQWDFDVIPKRIENQGKPAAFPALVDMGKSVALEVFESNEKAQTEHQKGVKSLLAMQLDKAFVKAARQLPLKQTTAMQFAPLGSAQNLRRHLVEGGFKDILDKCDLLVYTRAEFDRLLAQVEQDLFNSAVRRLLLAEPIMETQASAKSWLVADKKKQSPQSYADMQSQLDALFAPGFLRDLPHVRLNHYPRYLEALRVRAEHLRFDPGKDYRHLQLIAPYWQDYLAYAKSHPPSETSEVLRWLLEEWRVSLFAQPLKTAVPVSQKRIKRAFDALEQA